MIHVTLSGGKVAEAEPGVPAEQILDRVGVARASDAVAVKIDGKVRDVYTPLVKDCRLEPVLPGSEDGLEVLRHSSAHIMAQAVSRLFPDVEFAIGPVIEDGFYYDFDTPHKFTDEDLVTIEEEMARIAKEDLPIRRIEMTKEDAFQFLEGQRAKFKSEMLADVKEPVVSFYRQGEFVDWCRGPHLPSTGRLGAFKLLSIAGAYWRGDEKRDMLQRIYATAFPTKPELDDYLRRLEEAKRRDHKKLGKDLGLFMFHRFAPASPFFFPKGALVYNILVDYVRELYGKHGYTEVITPQIFDADLYRTSGHYDNFRDKMFFSEIDERQYGVKPMNCPGHCLMYGSRRWSYRELPVRYADFGRLHRYELSGVTQGLTRVRTFIQDDAHIFCAPDGLAAEMAAVIDFVDEVYAPFGFSDIDIALATMPEPHMGDEPEWRRAEETLGGALRGKGQGFRINPGEGAFYGPKIEWNVKDAIGRSWQLGTLQLDFNLPERFDLTFIAPSGAAERPLMLHRAVLGSLERFLGVYIEHVAGAFPSWIAPVQVAVLPVSDKFAEAADRFGARMKEAGLRAEVDRRNEKLGAKIRDAQLSKVPYMAVVGGREAESGTVSVRGRDGRQLPPMLLPAFIEGLRAESRSRNPHLTLGEPPAEKAAKEKR